MRLHGRCSSLVAFVALTVCFAACGIGCGRNGADPNGGRYDAAPGASSGRSDASVGDSGWSAIDGGFLDAGSGDGPDLGDATVDGGAVDDATSGGAVDDAAADGADATVAADTEGGGSAPDADACEGGAQQCIGRVIMTCVGGGWTLTLLCAQACTGDPPMCGTPAGCMPAPQNGQ
jgi:hypothetical protein